MDKILALIVYEIANTEKISIVNEWIYKISAQILSDICEGYEDSETVIDDKIIDTKEIDKILKPFRSAGFFCKIQPFSNNKDLLAFYIRW